MKQKIDRKAPYKGLTIRQYMAKKHPDIFILDSVEWNMPVLAGVFCGYAQGPMTDTGCINVCDRYSSCDEACHIGDLAKLVEGGYGQTWCDVCGELIPDSDDPIRVNSRKARYKVCSGTCAEKVMKKRAVPKDCVSRLWDETDEKIRNG